MLKSVDYVVGFHENTAVEIVRSLRPDIYVKSSFYEIASTPEGIEVLKYGGMICTALQIGNISTTDIIKKIVESQLQANMEADL